MEVILRTREFESPPSLKPDCDDCDANFVVHWRPLKQRRRRKADFPSAQDRRYLLGGAGPERRVVEVGARRAVQVGVRQAVLVGVRCESSDSGRCSDSGCALRSLSAWL